MSLEFSVRPALPEDLPAVAYIEEVTVRKTYERADIGPTQADFDHWTWGADLSGHYLGDFVHSTHDAMWVAEAKLRCLAMIVGFAAVSPSVSSRYATLQKLYVHPGMQGRGVGATLLTQAEQFAAIYNGGMVLETVAYSKAPKFYTDHDYRHDGTFTESLPNTTATMEIARYRKDFLT